jgi:potassium-transporting ATPase KdpC subunit
MRRQLLPAIRIFLVLTVVFGLLYPLVVTGIAQVTMRGKADGSLVTANGRVVGSSLIGQPFAGAQWFHGRPDPFDPTASGATNLGPTSADLIAADRKAVAKLVSAGATEPIPADAISGSGSGLDPDISPAYARLQVASVAAARGLAVGDVLALVDAHTQGRQLGFLGDPHVNVLALNLALEQLASTR